jgi:FkbM family methyltransferase
MIFNIQEINKLVPITGVIHVGGFRGEELPLYRSIGIHNTTMFEPQKKLCEIIKEQMIPSETLHNVALGCDIGKMELNISHRLGGVENGDKASSSLLKPKLHLIEHPEVTFTHTETVEVCRLDSYGLTANFMNIDVQGYELNVLKGAETTLQTVDALIVEVNRDEVYENCCQIEDIDHFLKQRGFHRAAVVWQSKSWGDALYARN